MAYMKLSTFFLVVLLLGCNQSGATGKQTFSKEEELALEMQLKIFNNPPVKIVQNEVGETYHCIDIKKQPTMDHPLHRNHNIQMRPTSYPEGMIDRPSFLEKHSRLTLKSLDCPKGTIPIRKTGKEDLIRAKKFLASYDRNIQPQTEQYPGVHMTNVRIKGNDGIVYKGVQGYVSIYNLTVGANQSTSSQLWIESGSGDQLTTLQAGWLVSRELYNDSLTRLFIYWRTSAFKPGKGCYNLLCSPGGFIQVDSKYPVDHVYTRTSIPGGQQYILQLYMFKDYLTGNWWLRVNTVDIGYWIGTEVPQLQEGATGIAWGGYVEGLPGQPSPPMGSGVYDAFNTKNTAYFRQLQVVDPSNNWVRPDKNILSYYNDKPDCYGIDWYDYKGEDIGYIFTFGGPGGNCGD